jgi:hypothetical protein
MGTRISVSVAVMPCICRQKELAGRVIPSCGSASRHRSADIRAWAKDRGIAVSERGRIPASVTEQYQAASKGR